VITAPSRDGTHLILTATNGLPGSSYSLVSSTNVAWPPSSWTILATGVFDSNGASSNSIPINFGEATRFFRLQLP